MDTRKVVRGFGKTSVSAGVLILLFVAYQLWGTGIAEARSQSKLKHDFAAATAPTSSPPITSHIPVPTTTAVAPRATPPGEALALIQIPKIHVDAAVVEGIGVDDLKKGPGHYPSTPIPGHAGNSAIAGHRTTYGAPFYRLDELRPGDEIRVTTHTSTFEYRVQSSVSVDPTDTAVLQPTKDNRLTLTTCTPRFTATRRLIVVAMLIGTVDPTPTPTVAPSPTDNLPGDAPAPANDLTLSGKGASLAPGVLWGLVCAAVWFLGWLFGQRWRRVPAYLLATPVFLACLFVFFENTARFVPANI